VLQSAHGEADATWPSVWHPRNKGSRFAPLIGELMLNENQLSFTLAPGQKGRPPVVSLAVPEGVGELVEINARTIGGRRNQLQIRQLPTGRFVVTGTMGTLARHRSWSGPSSNPHAVIEATWASALHRAGIEWIRAPGMGSATGTTGKLTLAEITSAPFDSIASEVNMRSLNIGAEAMLRWATAADPMGASKLTEHVRQITGDYLGVTLVDGSGLSSDDRATPYAFVTYLARFPATPAGRNFQMLLPANGFGTLGKLSRGGALAPGVVRAKTGTLGNAATLVGYLGHKDGLILISVMYNGSRVYAAKQQQWKLFRILGADGTMVPGDSALAETIGGEDREPLH
jgi:D-alanyl-D-alanine carboxypeptidase/D-alanyl-D-alanine-endopeptidase (penicillin-binding protein 4)